MRQRLAPSSVLPASGWHWATLCAAAASCCAFASCAALGGGRSADSVVVHNAALTSTGLFVTEVAQSTTYAGSTADKVEVYCAVAEGCDEFRVCDTVESGSSCSAVQPALSAGQRAVISRGTRITVTDMVWLADASGNELPGTRVGPFACDAERSRARIDCDDADFADCAEPGLESSSGACPSERRFDYQVTFTRNQHGQPGASCERAVCRQLLQLIDAARVSLDFAVYGVRAQPAIIDALAAAQARGVRVRGVVDTENADCSAFGYPDTPQLIARLSPGSVVCDVGPGYSYIMHNKFFVADAARTWTGSTNISDTETGGEYSSDVAMVIDSPALAAVYELEFEEMFAGQFHNRKSDNTPHELVAWRDGTRVSSYFSPTDHAIERGVIPLIERATASLDIAMFYFTEASIAQALLGAHARGVHVRMILDAGGAANQYSKHRELCASGIEVKVENWGGKSHSKWAVADAALDDKSAALFGSMNWTAAGNTHNDENTLYVRHAGLAGEFEREFERQWADLADTPVCTLVTVEGAQSSSCGPEQDCAHACASGSCCDGIDNDYDGRIDLHEEACGCADGVDNDEDGYVDADDYDCRPAPDDP